MPIRWNELPRDEWIALNAQIRRVVNALQAQGSYTDPVLIGGARLWVDATGDLRIKSTAPTTDLDGTVVGTQS